MLNNLCGPTNVLSSELVERPTNTGVLGEICFDELSEGLAHYFDLASVMMRSTECGENRFDFLTELEGSKLFLSLYFRFRRPLPDRDTTGSIYQYKPI